MRERSSPVRGLKGQRSEETRGVPRARSWETVVARVVVGAQSGNARDENGRWRCHARVNLARFLVTPSRQHHRM